MGRHFFLQERDGWRGISARANRDPEQFTETDDEADRRRIGDLIDGLLVKNLA